MSPVNQVQCRPGQCRPGLSIWFSPLKTFQIPSIFIVWTPVNNLELNLLAGLIFSQYCNRGPWPLLWPVLSGRHCSCRCSISGNYRTRSRLPHLSPESLRAPTAVRQSATSRVRHKKHSQVFGSCIYIFIIIVKSIVNIYLNAGWSIQLFHRCAVARFLMDSLSHRTDQLAAFPKTEWIRWPARTRYIVSSSARHSSVVALPLQMRPTCLSGLDCNAHRTISYIVIPYCLTWDWRPPVAFLSLSACNVKVLLFNSSRLASLTHSHSSFARWRLPKIDLSLQCPLWHIPPLKRGNP